MLALVLAAAAGLAANKVLTEAQSTSEAFGSRTTVVAAVTDLAPGHKIVSSDIKTRSWPDGFITGQPTTKSSAIGATVKSTIHAGELVPKERLFGKSNNMEPSERAVGLPIPAALPPLKVGDKVQLVAISAQADFESSAQTNTIKSKARILHLGQEAITLAIEQPMVEPVLAAAAVGSIEIVLAP